jgi:hypothetical protein
LMGVSRSGESGHMWRHHISVFDGSVSVRRISPAGKRP